MILEVSVYPCSDATSAAGCTSTTIYSGEVSETSAWKNACGKKAVVHRDLQLGGGIFEDMAATLSEIQDQNTFNMVHRGQSEWGG